MFASLYRRVARLQWRTLISSRWSHAEHINALELRAVCLALHWVLSHSSAPNSRLYLLTDSQVSLYILAKGRSHSSALQPLARKAAALQLSSGITLLTGWLPTENNPADRPSRLC